MRTFRNIFFLMIFVITLFSCKDDSFDQNQVTKQTILVFMPWSGSSSGNKGLYNNFLDNLDSIEGAIIKQKGLNNNRLIVFLSKTSDNSTMYEVSYENQKIIHNSIKEYSGHDYTTSDGIKQIINNASTAAPALNYAMIIGCHGTGWTFKDTWSNYPFNAKRFSRAQESKWPKTRFYGSASDDAFKTDIPTLSAAISNSGLKMQFILFDDCYMANAEIAYELRNVTNFLIASTSEVIDIGMPYAKMWQYLSSETPNYQSAVDAFHNFYSSYSTPCGTLTAIDCRTMDKLASLMKQINARYTLPSTDKDSIQILDGFDNGAIFYDLGDYVNHLCQDQELKDEFANQLKLTVRSTSHTDSIYSNLTGIGKFIKIKNFSGVTVSDPSTNSVVLKGMSRTSWYSATH